MRVTVFFSDVFGAVHCQEQAAMLRTGVHESSWIVCGLLMGCFVMLFF